MGTAIKHPVPDRVKPSFVIFDIRALWRSVLSCTHMATVGFKGLSVFSRYQPMWSDHTVSFLVRVQLSYLYRIFCPECVWCVCHGLLIILIIWIHHKNDSNSKTQRKQRKQNLTTEKQGVTYTSNYLRFFNNYFLPFTVSCFILYHVVRPSVCLSVALPAVKVVWLIDWIILAVCDCSDSSLWVVDYLK